MALPTKKPLFAAPLANKRPRMLGRYHVLDEIGRNAVGPLYLARLEGPKGFQRWAAIRRVDKRHVAEEGYVQRFYERVRAGAKLLHPNVTALFDVGEEDGAPWVAMEYLHGERIETAIERLELADTPASWEIAARIIADAAEGLQAVHELRDREGAPLGLMHGDLAPHSLVVTYEGKTKVKGAFEPRVHGVLDPRKVPYAAPEQLFEGSVDARADVFALGVLLWELLAGKRLFARATEHETRAMIEAGVVPSLTEIVDDLPREIDALVRRALMRSPASRFSSARELSRELESLLVQKGVVARDDDVGRYMRTLFADRYTDQEARLQAASDVTEIWRRSQQAPSARALAALPDVSAKDEEESEATELMRQPFGSDEDRTTAERPVAKPVSGYTDEVAQADSGPTNPRIPPKPAELHDTDEIPTMTAPQSTLAPKAKPLPKAPERDRSDDDTQTAPRDPGASGASRLIMPSSLISDPEVTESAIFVAPRIPVPTPPDTETSVAPMPPPRPMMPSFPDRPLLPSTPQAGVTAIERPRLNSWPPAPGTPPPLSTRPPPFTPPPAFPQQSGSRGPHLALSTTSLRAVLFPQDRAKRIFVVSIVGLIGGAILFFVFLAVWHASDRSAQVPAAASAVTTKPAPSATPTSSATVTATATASAAPHVSASVAPSVPQIPTFDLTSPQPTRRPHATHTTAPPAATHEAPAAGKTGFLTVICRPNACDHVLDGSRDLGDTPLYKHELTAGKHVLTLRVDSTHASKVVTVDVPEGENVTIRPDTP